jgi:hypothetical protein
VVVLQQHFLFGLHCSNSNGSNNSNMDNISIAGSMSNIGIVGNIDNISWSHFIIVRAE